MVTKFLVNGTSADADDVSTILIDNIMANAINYINAIAEGNETYYDNVFHYWIPITESNVDVTGINLLGDYNGAFAWMTNREGIFNGEVYDTYSDGSFDATKWTTTISAGTMDETEEADSYVSAAETLTQAAALTGTLEAYGSGEYNNLKNVSYDNEVYLKWYVKARDAYSSGTASGILYIKDEDGHDVALKSFTGSGGLLVGTTVDSKIVFTSSTTLDFWWSVDDWATETKVSDVDISSLTGDYWFLKLRTSAPSSVGAYIKEIGMRFYHIIYANDSTWGATTGLLTSETIVDTSTLTHFMWFEPSLTDSALPSANYTGALVDMSFDGGSTWETSAAEKTLYATSQTLSGVQPRVIIPAATSVNTFDYFKNIIVHFR